MKFHKSSGALPTPGPLWLQGCNSAVRFYYRPRTFFFLVTPLMRPETDSGVFGPPANCLKEVIEPAVLNPLSVPPTHLVRDG